MYAKSAVMASIMPAWENYAWKVLKKWCLDTVYYLEWIQKLWMMSGKESKRTMQLSHFASAS